MSKNEMKKKSKKKAISSDEEDVKDFEQMDLDEVDSDTEKPNEESKPEVVEEPEKKLTHKDKKKLKKQQEYEKQMEMITKKGGQGHSELDSNFTISQTQKTAGLLFSSNIFIKCIKLIKYIF